MIEAITEVSGVGLSLEDQAPISYDEIEFEEVIGKADTASLETFEAALQESSVSDFDLNIEGEIVFKGVKETNTTLDGLTDDLGAHMSALSENLDSGYSQLMDDFDSAHSLNDIMKLASRGAELGIEVATATLHIKHTDKAVQFQEQMLRQQ
jgi:hypothetical protein